MSHSRMANFLPGGGGGAVNHLPKNSCKLPKFVTDTLLPHGAAEVSFQPARPTK